MLPRRIELQLIINGKQKSCLLACEGAYLLQFQPRDASRWEFDGNLSAIPFKALWEFDPTNIIIVRTLALHLFMANKILDSQARPSWLYYNFASKKREGNAKQDWSHENKTGGRSPSCIIISVFMKITFSFFLSELRIYATM